MQRIAGYLPKFLIAVSGLRRAAAGLALALAILTGLPPVAHAVCSLPWIPEQGGLRAMSLARTSELLSARPTKKNDISIIQQLAKIERLVGFVEDSANNDVILIGWTNNSLPALHFDDLVEALLNASTDTGPMMCTLLPQAATLARLQSLGNALPTYQANGSIPEFAKKYKHICEEPQDMIVREVRPTSHASHVMVTADYQMKSIVDGTHTLEIPGLNSYADRFFNASMDSIKLGGSVINQALNRFWFTPGQVTYASSGHSALLDRCPVTLDTHPIGVTGGTLGDTVGEDPIARKYCADFSALYGQVARAEPLYRDLENVFRAVAIAQMMKQSNLLNHNVISNLTAQPSREVFPFKKTFPGRSTVKVIDYRDTTKVVYGAMPLCGGVEIDIKPEKRPSRNRIFADLEYGVLSSRPTPKSLWWDVKESVAQAYRAEVRQRYLHHPEKGHSVAFISFINNAFTIRIGDDTLETTSRNIPELANKLVQALERNKQKVVTIIPDHFSDDDKMVGFLHTLNVNLASRKSLKLQFHIVDRQYGDETQLSMEGYIAPGARNFKHSATKSNDGTYRVRITANANLDQSDLVVPVEIVGLRKPYGEIFERLNTQITSESMADFAEQFVDGLLAMKEPAAILNVLVRETQGRICELKPQAQTLKLAAVTVRRESP